MIRWNFLSVALTLVAAAVSPALAAATEPPPVGPPWVRQLAGQAVDTLAAIAARLPKTKPTVKEALLEAFPPAGGTEVETKLREALARKVHQHLTTLTGRRVPFPSVYDEAARAKLVKSW